MSPKDAGGRTRSGPKKRGAQKQTVSQQGGHGSPTPTELREQNAGVSCCSALCADSEWTEYLFEHQNPEEVHQKPQGRADDIFLSAGSERSDHPLFCIPKVINS